MWVCYQVTSNSLSEYIKNNKSLNNKTEDFPSENTMRLINLVNKKIEGIPWIIFLTC